MRSLVADLGSDLGCGAHLTALRRTASGRFTLAQAVPLERLADPAVREHIIPLSEVTTLPRITVPDAMKKHALSGVQFSVEAWGEVEKAERYQLVDERGQLVAIIHFEAGKTLYDRVFPELTRA